MPRLRYLGQSLRQWCTSLSSHLPSPYLIRTHPVNTPARARLTASQPDTSPATSPAARSPRRSGSRPCSTSCVVPAEHDARSRLGDPGPTVPRVLGPSLGPPSHWTLWTPRAKRMHSRIGVDAAHTYAPLSGLITLHCTLVRRAYLIVDHVPDRNSSSFVLGVATNQTTSSTICRFRVRYAHAARSSS